MQALRRSSVMPVLSCASIRMCRRFGAHLAAVLATVALIAATMPRAEAQHVVAVVNGTPITSYDVDQRNRLIQLSGAKALSRKQVLEELIDEKVKLLEAKRYGLEASETEVNSHYANMASRMGMNSEQLTQLLNRRGVNPITLRSRIRSEIVWGNLVRGRYQASLQVGEGDVLHMLRQSTEDEAKGTVGHVYTLRPILFIVPQGSPSSLFDVRRREAEAFRSRVTDCKQAVVLARDLRDVAVRDTIVRNSAGLPEPMRKMLNSLEIGALTAPEPTPQGIELFALCGKETTRADTPRKHEARQEIFAKRYEAHSKRYLERIRRAAMIEYK